MLILINKINLVGKDINKYFESYFSKGVLLI